MSRNLDRLSSARYGPRAVQGWCCGESRVAQPSSSLTDGRACPRGPWSGGAREGRLELSTGLFYMSAYQALGLIAVAPGLGAVNRLVLQCGSRERTGRLQVEATVAVL